MQNSASSKKFVFWFLPLIAIFLIALVGGVVINTINADRGLSGDEVDYQMLAEKFAESRKFGLPDAMAYRAPLYPMVLGSAYKILGNSLLVARGLNTVLAALMVLVAGLLVRKVSKRTWLVYIAAILVMVNSYWWLHQSVLMQENLAAVLLGFSVWCWPNFGDRDRAVSARFKKHGIWVITSGLLFGLSQLAKPLLMPLLVCLPLVSLILSPPNQRRTQLAFSLVFLLSALLPIGSWTLRNYSTFDQLVPITTGSGEVFWGAHAPQTIATSKGMWTSQPLPDSYQTSLDAEAPKNREILSSNLKWKAGWESLGNTNHWDKAIHFGMKIVRLWSPSTYFSADQAPIGIKYLLIAFNSVTLFLFFVGLNSARNDRPLILSIVLSLTVTCFFFWGSIRFQYMILPIIASVASVTLRRFFRKRKEKETRPNEQN